MKLQTWSQSDFLDILFNGRNKKYGAYELRIHYAGRTYKAIAFTFLITAGICITIYILTHTKPDPSNRTLIYHPITTTYIPASIPKIITPPPQAPPTTPRQIKTDIFSVPKIVIDKPDLPPVETPKGEIAGSNTIGSGPITSGPSITTGTGPAKIIPPVPELPKTWAEQMPDFKGDLRNYLNTHLQYPEIACTSNIYGKVIVQFIVNEDGSVSNAKILRGIGGGCDEEALRVVSNMPAWRPGKQNGKEVKVYFTLPIIFTLQ